MSTIKITARNSALSLLQVERVKRAIGQVSPGTRVEFIPRSSQGDRLRDIPLQRMEGRDFFTEEIFETLNSGEADIAVHSLKDMSASHFFGGNHFALVERDDTRDIALFNPGIEENIRKGETIIVGTCSSRREAMATLFLKKALPQLHTDIRIQTVPVRGNVESRLRQLDKGDMDATILATAGLNRLLTAGKYGNESIQQTVSGLLQNKKKMLLPLVECVPAPCQGAIVAEALSSNLNAVALLEKINQPQRMADCIREKKEASRFGTGCFQPFGVTSIQTRHIHFLYAAGTDTAGNAFEKWEPLTTLKVDTIFDSTLFMKDFFRYQYLDAFTISPDSPVVFISNYKAVQVPGQHLDLSGKTILASGTKTWYELARQGYWVSASADALGFEFLLPSLSMPLLDIYPEDITLVTHASAAERWQQNGFKTCTTYRLMPQHDKALQKSIAAAKAVFWSSYAQFEQYGTFTGKQTIHLCAGGETASLLQQSGIEPIIFPTIQSFRQWKKYSIPSTSAA